MVLFVLFLFCLFDIAVGVMSERGAVFGFSVAMAVLELTLST